MAAVETPKQALVYQFPHDIEKVFNEITSAEYIKDRSGWIGDRAEIDINDIANGRTVTLDRYVTKEYPKALRKLFPPEQHMAHSETWARDGVNFKGGYTVKVSGVPIVVSSEFTLKKTGIGCDLAIWHTVTCKIPLLGGKIEKYILGETRAQFGDQLHYLDMRLKGTPNLLPRDKDKYPVPH